MTWFECWALSGVAAILLAAGESRRMGEVNKLTLKVEGEALLQRMARLLCQSDVQTVVVVVGHEAEQARQLLAGLAVTVVENKDYRQGQMTSVDCGLAALSDDYAGVMIALSDQPLLEVADINRLIQVFERQPREVILVPTYEGQRGNPIIIAQLFRRSILGGQRNLGCRRLIENNQDAVVTVTMADDHVTFDLDTAVDVERWQQRLALNKDGV